MRDGTRHGGSRTNRPCGETRRRHGRVVGALCLLIALLAGAPPSAVGQAVMGRVVTADGSPVPWAVVRLVSPAQGDVAGDVTSATGTFRLAAPQPGTYRIRADRIGFRSTVSDSVEITSGRNRFVVLVASEEPIELEALDVRGEGSCGLRPDEGSELFAIWREIEKALELQTATERSGLFRFHGEVYEYPVDRAGRPVDREAAFRQTRAVIIERRTSGFYAADPDMLEALGYLWDGRVFYGPDAHTLLSESFQRTHCFRAERDGDRLGLSFRPDGNTGDRVDVEGTLWLEAASGKLRTLEFRYVSDRVPAKLLDGGLLEFDQLPEGAWIVRRWWIRWPTQDARGRSTGRLAEAGGRVLEVEKAALRLPLTAERVPTPAGLLTDRPAPTAPVPEEALEALSLFRAPPDSADVSNLLARHPGFASGEGAELAAARSALWRRAGHPDLARDALYGAFMLDPRRGLVDVERARLRFLEGRPAEATAAFRTACATGDSLTLEALWSDLRGLATSDELADWKGRPVTHRCSLLAEMLADRALRSALPVHERLALHYARLELARSEWRLPGPRVQAGAADSLRRHPDLELDDRGFIYLRLGEPDEVAYAIAGETGIGNRVEGWRYDRPEGPRIFFFAPITRLSVGIWDFRLLDAPWRALGDRFAANPLDLVNMADLALAGSGGHGDLSARDVLPSNPLTFGDLPRLMLSFQGLDPAYTTLSYRAVRGGTSLLEDLAAERAERLKDVVFAADSAPDAPDVDPRLGFAWERLRFLNPASGSTTAWMLVAVPAKDLRGLEGVDGRTSYGIDVVTAIRRAAGVEMDSVRTGVESRAVLGDGEAVIGRIPLSVGAGEHPFTVVVRDANTSEPAIGNWTRGTFNGLAPSDLPEVSDIAVAADSGGLWTRDGVTYLAVSPMHVTTPDGTIHVYFEVYGVPAASPYTVDVRIVPEEASDRLWQVGTEQLAFRLSFPSQMPAAGGIATHHLRLDLSDSPAGPYTLGIRVAEDGTSRESLPATTLIIRSE